MVLALVSSLAAQSSKNTVFELSQYEFEPGISQKVDLNLAFNNARANQLEIENPFPGLPLIVESVKIVTGGKTSDIWLTMDSILFSKNLPQTAWIVSLENLTRIRTADDIQNGDRVIVRLLLVTPKNAITSEKHISISVSLNSTAVSQYVSSKPVLIKSQGSIK